MIDDAVALEEVELLPDVLLLIFVRPDDKEFRVGPCHALEWLGRVQDIENPTAAIGGSDHSGAQARKQPGVHAKASPDRHSLPVDAMPFTALYCPCALLDTLIQFFQEQPIHIDCRLEPPADNGG